MQRVNPGFNMLAPAVAVALLNAAAGPQPRVIENRGQALPKGALKAAQGSRQDRRASTKAAAQELVSMSNQTLVVAHLHPRWLRQAVNALMDKGAHIDMAWVEQLKALGPEGAATAVQVYG